MNTKKLIQVLGFKPKENTSGIFHKIYSKLAGLLAIVFLFPCF